MKKNNIQKVIGETIKINEIDDTNGLVDVDLLQYANIRLNELKLRQLAYEKIYGKVDSVISEE
jgi:hypothetical protein